MPTIAPMAITVEDSRLAAEVEVVVEVVAFVEVDGPVVEGRDVVVPVVTGLLDVEVVVGPVNKTAAPVVEEVAEVLGADDVAGEVVAGTPEVGPAEVGPAEVGPAEVAMVVPAAVVVVVVGMVVVVVIVTIGGHNEGGSSR